MARQRILFIHQNFPGQFVHAAAELARQGHQVVALAIQRNQAIQGVELLRYAPRPPGKPSDVDAARDFETKVVRGLACAQAMERLRARGFVPDTIVAHPGWGEALFCKDVWPAARLLIYAEFFYASDRADYNFDPEFAHDSVAERARLRMKNSVHLHALHACDGGYSPTQWQRAQLPGLYRNRFEVIFDGIDTAVAAPSAAAELRLSRENIRLVPGDEVITFVNRNLEPYRGFHIFMRALPEILHRRPNARCLIVGRDDVSYGSQPTAGGNWRQVMLSEVGAQLPLDRVHFLGGLPYQDYLRVMQVSACHVYLTYPFVLSWSCLEALSMARVVVGSRTGPVEEVITHGENGLLVDFFDPAALAQQVVDVLTDPAGHVVLGRRARERVVAEYDLRTRCLPRLIGLMLG